jgi:glycosyltransferase involved in cell wall biosynthesis
MASGPGISILINTRNEFHNLRACVESVKWADEILVVDMESEDGTPELARELGCRVLTHERMGFVEPARQFGASQTSNEWVLVLDADERVSEKTEHKLREIAQSAEVAGVKIPRKNHWKGRFLDCCGWYPDTQLRFLRKSRSCFPKLIHHQPEVTGKIQSLPPQGDHFLIHDTVTSWSARFEKLAKYGKFSADAMLEKGRSIGVTGIFLRVVFTFLANYLLKGGFLRGELGLFLSMERACASFMKYTSLWELHHDRPGA